MQDQPKQVRISVEGIPERDRFEFWRETVGRIIRQDMLPVDGPFWGESVISTLPNLTITTATHSPYRLVRKYGMAADDRDLLIMTIYGRGRVVGHIAGREVEAGPGEAVVWRSGQTWRADYAPQEDRILLTIPRAILATAVADMDKDCFKFIPRGFGALPLLESYLRSLQSQAATISPELQFVSATHVHDLIALTLGATRDAAEIAKGRGLRAARRQAVKADIAKHLADSDLSQDAVARRLGISPRYIRVLFNDEETSFTDYVLGQRLSRAHRLLLDPGHADWTVMAIALECGFGDMSYFYQAFRRRFRATPSDVRNAARSKL